VQGNPFWHVLCAFFDHDQMLNWKLSLNNADGTTKAWVVTTDGFVPNETMKQMAERDAWYVLGGQRGPQPGQAER
jgi:hypothetical protein